MIQEKPGTNSLLLAYSTSVFCTLVAALYGFKGVEPAPLADTFLRYAPIIAVVLWLHRDAGLTGRMQVQDLGLFLYAGWPILLPWHILRTRGARGWGLIFKLFALIFVPLIVASVAQTYRMLH